MNFTKEMYINNGESKIIKRTSNAIGLIKKYKIIAISIVFTLALIGIDLILLNNFFSILIKL